MTPKRKAKPRERPSFREALGMGKKRLGSFVREPSKPARKEPIPKGFEEELAGEIRRLKSLNSKHKRLPTKRMAHALLRELGLYSHKPTAIQVAQALVRSRGTHKDALLPWMNAALSLQRRLDGRGVEIIDGRLESLNSLVRKNVLHNVREKLVQDDGPYTTRTLDKRTGGGHRLVINALNLLEAAGLAERVSLEGKGGNKQEYRWMATERAHRAPIPKGSAGYRLWSAMGVDPLNISELAKRAGMHAKEAEKYIDRLVTAGLVDVGERGRTATYVLTRKGMRLSARQRRSEYFEPELRRAILMRPSEQSGRRRSKKSALNGLSRRRIERYGRTALCMRVRAEYAELERHESGVVKGGLVKGLAAKYGLTKNQVWQMVDHLPIGNMTSHRMWVEVLPAMREIDPEGAVLFERFLLNNEGKLKGSVSGSLRKAAERERAKALKRAAGREHANLAMREKPAERGIEGPAERRLRLAAEAADPVVQINEAEKELRWAATAPHAEVQAKSGMAKHRYLGELHARIRALRARLGEE